MKRVHMRIAGTLVIAGAVLSTIAASAAVARIDPPVPLSAPPSGRLITRTHWTTDQKRQWCLVGNTKGVVRTQPCNTLNSQVWEALAGPPSTPGRTLMNKATGQCLEGTDREVPYSEKGIRTGGCSRADTAQGWQFDTTDSPRGFAQMINDWHPCHTTNGPHKCWDPTGMVLASPGAPAGLVEFVLAGTDTPDPDPILDWHATGTLALIAQNS